MARSDIIAGYTDNSISRPKSTHMPWKSAQKTTSIMSVTPHNSRITEIQGRAPGITTFDFTPAELFGATAQCSHLHVINQRATTPESIMMGAMIAQHVDDINPSFSILKSANCLKDFVQKYFTGTVAAGLAYLALIRDGYHWFDHFENIAGGNQNVHTSPDFIFIRGDNSGLALVESAGTRTTSRKRFNQTIGKKYDRQVVPHLGQLFGKGLATHGYCIGSWLTSPTSAEIHIHHTSPTPALTTAPGGSPDAVGIVQQHNFATAFRLAHGVSLAAQIRRGNIDEAPIPFVEFGWLERRWLSRPLSPIVTGAGTIWPDWLAFIGMEWDWRRTFQFAIEKSRAEEVLRQLSRRPEIARPIRFDLEPVSDDLRFRGREVRAGVFPTGLALIPTDGHVEDIHSAFWDPRRRHFSENPQ